MPDGQGGRSLFGNLTLSRLPVGQVFRHSLPRRPKRACRACRGCAWR
jgi:endonuclease/exonuclease/phosphatase family metal-dependent hydrolase